jgi:catechol 2,3-dioxygenase-like lactoylglutathione lyase family enzyme
MTISSPVTAARVAVARAQACVCNSPGVAVAHRIAPIFLVRDLAAALEHYRRLGFSVREYAGGGYGYAARENVEIHLGVVPDEPRPGAAYLFVDDAGALANEWRAAGVEVRGPEDTEWGQHEGAVVDPDGNVIRFGSPM